jgi:prefoldin subunit 5
MRFQRIILVLLLLLSATGLTIQAADPNEEIVSLEGIEDIEIPEPPDIVIPQVPLAAEAEVIDVYEKYCVDLTDAINRVIDKNRELIETLNSLKAEINNKANQMQAIINKASSVRAQMLNCWGKMQGTSSCAGPGYQPGDWANHDPNASFIAMNDARDDLLDLISDIDSQITATNDRINSLQDLLANLSECVSEEDAAAIYSLLDALLADTTAAFAEIVNIQNAAITAINDFNDAYADFKSRISDFLAKTQSVINDNAPNSVANIRRSCGMSRRAAIRERRKRRRVILCLRALKNHFNRLP